MNYQTNLSNLIFTRKGYKIPNRNSRGTMKKCTKPLPAPHMSWVSWVRKT